MRTRTLIPLTRFRNDTVTVRVCVTVRVFLSVGSNPIQVVDTVRRHRSCRFDTRAASFALKKSATRWRNAASVT
jgi:hypothetical protein